VALTGNLRKMTVSVFTTQGLDLWPGGFTDPNTGAPLTAGGFGIGFVLPASVNGGTGGEGLAWNGDLITAADMDIFDTTGAESGNTGPLPLNVFFNSTTAWNGVFGVIFTDDAPPGWRDQRRRVSHRPERDLPDRPRADEHRLPAAAGRSGAASPQPVIRSPTSSPANRCVLIAKKRGPVHHLGRPACFVFCVSQLPDERCGPWG
jgi:hypothetical protein